MKQWLFVALSVFLASSIAVSWWSYHLVDPNLTLFTSAIYQDWQRMMWERAGDSARLAREYALIMTVVWLAYGWVLLLLRQTVVKNQKSIFLFWLISAGVLFVGHNALSHDIFNYLFNAKMVLVYGANPHVKTALDFAQDPWIRFMHNVHTPAPYAWGWTALSLIPFGVSLGKFLLAYFGMKLWMLSGALCTLFFVWQLLKNETWSRQERIFRLSLLAFNPLFLIETIMNGHNDVWMMWPVLAGLWLVTLRKISWWKRWPVALLLFGISLSTKYATILVSPVFVLLAVQEGLASLASVPLAAKFRKLLEKGMALVLPYWADYSALIMLVPLLTPRSQQFHPWYAIWFLAFLPLCRLRWVQALLIGLSVSSTFRYLPWLSNGLEYTPLVQQQMRQITWSGIVLGGVLGLFKKRRK